VNPGFCLFGALGQFERDLIREQTRAGLTAAALRGRKGGRKPVVMPISWRVLATWSPKA
jgi:DNA invertase Pin-like site-specific DNA recombinase